MIKRNLLAVALIMVLALFLYAHPALADDCSSASDCAAVLRGTGGIATLLALLLGATAARRRGKEWRQEWDDQDFKDCQEAADWVSRSTEEGEFDAIFEPKLGKPYVGELPGGRYNASVEVTWSYDAKSSYIKLPRWNGATGKDKAAWNNYVDLLREHEVKHIEILREYAERVSGPVGATGNSPEEAQHNLQEELERLRQEFDETLDNLTKEYDDLTKHGEKQSNIPGGKDVVFKCP